MDTYACAVIRRSRDNVRNMLLLTSYAGDSRTVQPVLKTLQVKR